MTSHMRAEHSGRGPTPSLKFASEGTHLLHAIGHSEDQATWPQIGETSTVGRIHAAVPSWVGDLLVLGRQELTPPSHSHRFCTR